MARAPSSPRRLPLPRAGAGCGSVAACGSCIFSDAAMVRHICGQGVARTLPVLALAAFTLPVKILPFLASCKTLEFGWLKLELALRDLCRLLHRRALCDPHAWPTTPRKNAPPRAAAGAQGHVQERHGSRAPFVLCALATAPARHLALRAAHDGAGEVRSLERDTLEFESRILLEQLRQMRLTTGELRTLASRSPSRSASRPRTPPPWRSSSSSHTTEKLAAAGSAPPPPRRPRRRRPTPSRRWRQLKPSARLKELAGRRPS